MKPKTEHVCDEMICGLYSSVTYTRLCLCVRDTDALSVLAVVFVIFVICSEVIACLLPLAALCMVTL